MFRHGLCAQLLLALLVWFSGIGGLHAEVVVIDAQAERFDLSSHMTILRDPDRRLSFSEVAADVDGFTSATRRDLVTSFNPGVFWLRVSLRNDSAETLVRWLAVGTAKTPRVTLHLRQGTDWQFLNSGRSVAVLEKPLVTLDPVFPLTLPPGKALDLLLRIDSRGATEMATELWHPEDYHHAVGKRQMFLALVQGGLLVGSVLSLFAFGRMRERHYLWLGLLLLGVAGLEAIRENLLGTYFWPAHVPLPPYVLALFAALSTFSLAKVVTHALELEQHIPAAYHLLRVLRGVVIVGAVVALVSYGHGIRILSLSSVTLNLATLVASLLTWRRSPAEGAIFLLAFSLALLTETARQLANLGVLPWVGAMDFSLFFFLLASPLIHYGLLKQAQELHDRLAVSENLQQAKSAFFARISHELRSPLNTILGYSRMLARQSPRLSLAEGTAGIEKHTLRLLKLINEVLDNARATAGQLHVTPGVMQVKPWLEEVATSARISIEAGGNQLVCSFSGKLDIRIEADSERLGQVVQNLLANANRHTRQGTIRFDCTVSPDSHSALLEFVVEDNGEGIAADRLPHIFKPFVRGATSSAGHGLGLSICRELLRQMGGDIVVTSQVGQGSRFAFSLHCSLVDADQVSGITPSMQNEGPPRALLIEDDPVQLEILAGVMKEAGFAVEPLLDAATAIEQVAAECWDIVITDQMMPVFDGWAVLRSARAVRPKLPVIMISAAEPCRPPGLPADIHFDVVLRKPVDPMEMISTVRRLLVTPVARATSIAEAEWSTLRRLASEGDVSGVEDWLDACRHAWPDAEPTLHRIETALHQLDFKLLERIANGSHRD